MTLQYRTKRETDTTTRGKFVDFVLVKFVVKAVSRSGRVSLGFDASFHLF